MLKIDTIIGNPPYNDRIDTEFFVKAHSMNCKFISFIHPAKWRAIVEESNAVYMQKVALVERHLKHISFFEATGHAESSVWPGVQTGSVNYWLMDLDNTFNDINVSYQLTTKTFDGPVQSYKFNTERLKKFPYILMNEYIQGIIEKVISSENFRPIIDKFADCTAGEVWVANTLFRAFTIEEKTNDSRIKGFLLEELPGLNKYLRTPFWRAITRQLKTGFHSYEQSIFKYLPDLDFCNIDVTEKYLEDLFELNERERWYLSEFANDISSLP